MGQKLERLSEKDEESQENSDWSDQTAEIQRSQTTEQDESRNQDDGQFMKPGSLAVGQVGGHTVFSACAVPQTGQPIRPLGQQEHPLDTKRQWVGGDTEGWSVIRIVEGSDTVQNLKETRYTLNCKPGSRSTAVAFTGTTAMEQQGNGRKSGFGCSKLGPDSQTRGLTNPRNPTNEEEFVLLERAESWASTDGENNITFADRIKTKNPQSSIRRRVEEDASASYSDDNLSQPSPNNPEDEDINKESRGRGDTLLEAHAESSPPACFKREMGQHLAELTGSRCQLKGVSHDRAAHTETTRRRKAEREQNMNDHRKEQMHTNISKEHLSTQNNSRLVKRLRESTADLENMHDRAVQLTLQEEGDEERAVKSNGEPCLETVELSLRESQNTVEESHNSGFIALKTQQADPSHQSRFAGAVSKRAKAGVTGTLRSNDKEENDQAFCKAAHSHSLKAKPYSAEIQQLQDNPSFSVEQCDLIPGLPQPDNEGCNGKTQISTVKAESDLVCCSPAITSPPLTRLLPAKDTSVVTQLQTSVINSERAPDATSCDSKEESISKEKPKVKGPPPPVAKKPKNPFIKLKTAQLMSSDMQRRGKDHLKHSEERVKRRHTIDFNIAPPRNNPTNQDMCVLWDERGTYTVPTNTRRLSFGLNPWEHFSLKHMDDRYGDMIDFDYCGRIAKLSPDEELQNLDMMQRRVFLERRSRFKSSPPPVANKTSTPFASTETVHAPEVTSDKETMKPACAGKREIHPEPLSERVSPQVDHAKYGNRKDVTDHRRVRDAGNASEVGSYKPVAEIVKQTNQMQKHQGRAKSEGAKVQMTEQSPSVKVSQMKNTFDAPKKSKERPQDVQLAPKKGKPVRCIIYVLTVAFAHKYVL